jgi:hypothetical protein
MQARIISSTPLSTTSGSAVAPPGTSVTVQNAGSGCSGRGTVPYMVDPTFTALNLTTPNLIVSNSGNSGPRVARKNCAITLGFNYPAGWQYAVQNGGWSGTANVPAGVTGLSAGHYYFAGESNQVGTIPPSERVSTDSDFLIR